MIVFTLLATTVIATLAGLAILCVATARPAYQTTAGLPFGIDAAAETIVSSRSEGTLAGDWKEVELCRLCDAEELLDQLECAHMRSSEMDIVDNNRFVVRWR